MGYTHNHAIFALLCAAAIRVTAQVDEHIDMDMGQMTSSPSPSPSLPPNKNFDLYDEPNYASHEGFAGMMVAHVLFMIVAWFFVLPVGKLKCAIYCRDETDSNRRYVQHCSFEDGSSCAAAFSGVQWVGCSGWDHLQY